jgi:hypothetical protein
MTGPASVKAVAKPPLTGSSSSSTGRPVPRAMERASTTPNASGTIATTRGSAPVAPVKPRTTGPTNWQAA